MTVAPEPSALQSTVLDIRTYEATVDAAQPASARATPAIGLPFRTSVNANATHTALTAYLTSFGFLCLLLFTGLNMRMLSSPSLSTAAGEQSDNIVAFCVYSLCLMLVLLCFGYYVFRVMSGGMLRARRVRDSDRVLLNDDWLAAQRAQRERFERAAAVSVWSVVRSDQSVRAVLTVVLSVYCCLSLVWHATRLSTVELILLASTSSAAMTAAALTNELLGCMTAFVLSDCLQPLLTFSLLGCPAVHIASDGLLLAACQLLLGTAAYVTARLSSRPITALLLSTTFHSRLLLAPPSRGTFLTFLACSLSSLPLHRIAFELPQPTISDHVDDGEDDADISEELWRVRQFACMVALYAVASNGWRCMHCLLGDGMVQDALWLAVLLLFGVREYKLRERHKQV